MKLQCCGSIIVSDPLAKLRAESRGGAAFRLSIVWKTAYPAFMSMESLLVAIIVGIICTGAAAAYWLRRYSAAQQALAVLKERLADTERGREADRRLLQDAREEMALQFQVLANRILEEKSARFTETNAQNIDRILKPLQERIGTFQAKVEHTYDQETQQRAALKQQVELLAAQSRTVGEQANQLAAALKGDNKKLGNWGELLLERALEVAGLEKGKEFVLQSHNTDSSGAAFRPDAIVYLPDNRCVIVDSKVSLKDYEAFFNEADEARQRDGLKKHIASIQTHISQLSAKQYAELEAFRGRAPDFVLMFIPLEPAYVLALSHAPNLLEEAAKANIILVGPSTLLATLRIIAQFWRQHIQAQHIREIVDDVQRLYEKFAGFAINLEQVGQALDKAKGAYDQACGQLSKGPGNLVGRVEKFRKKRIVKNVTKAIPEKFLSAAEAGDMPADDDEA